MPFGRGRRHPAPARTDRRRSGPVGEARWWDPLDQKWAEQPVVPMGILGRGWRSVPMMNNVERLDPLGSAEAATSIRAAWEARTLQALDEGQAWRRHRDGALLVARVEVFATDEAEAHRAAWRAEGAGALDALWRERWRERAVDHGWIEARLRVLSERPEPLHAFPEATPVPEPAGSVDWFTVEDHTTLDPEADRAVTVYEHVLVWRGRALTTLTFRHDSGADLDATVTDVAVAVATRPSPP